MEAIVARTVAPWRFSVWMFTLFAVLAFVLATLGLFSLVSLDIVHRRHEFAVRVALGAQSRDVVRSVMTAAGRHVLAGLGVGVLMAALGARLVQGMLFDVRVLDLPTYAVVIGLVLAVVLSASYFPARRAGAVDPWRCSDASKRLRLTPLRLARLCSDSAEIDRSPSQTARILTRQRAPRLLESLSIGRRRGFVDRMELVGQRITMEPSGFGVNGVIEQVAEQRAVAFPQIPQLRATHTMSGGRRFEVECQTDE